MTILWSSSLYGMLESEKVKSKEPSQETAGAFIMPQRRCAMPRKPKTPCSHPGCPELTETRFCEKHAKQEAARYEKYDRDPATHKRYGRTWKRIRDRYVSEHPLCEECLKLGRMTPVAEVHHILPLSQGGTHVEDNLMSLCTPCHSAITARSGDRWHRR